MEILKQFDNIPIDFAVLKSVFPDYNSVKDKIASLEKSGKIIRLKRGLYVISSEISGKLLSLELIANHIYGPSYLSMETALVFYGLIPERVYLQKSVTTKPAKKFTNTLANFEYIHCKKDYFPIGIKQIVDNNISFLIASPEKALCDLICFTSQLRPRFVKSMQTFLENDLRLDMEAFYKMDKEIFEKCATKSKKKTEIMNLIKLLP